MYKPKPCYDCEMPAPGTPLRALVLNASLKDAPAVSNTGEVVDLVLGHLAARGVTGETIRLADRRIPVGLGYQESEDDEWPEIVAKLKAADIVIFATPIWWGGRSSLMQRVIERMDALDEEYRADGRSALYNKVAGIVITGSEDGALATMGSIMMVLTWMGFTLPAGVRRLLGGRGRPADERGGRETPRQRGDRAHGEEPRAEPFVLRAAAEAAPVGGQGLRWVAGRSRGAHAREGPNAPRSAFAASPSASRARASAAGMPKKPWIMPS
jgi:multimeric flavodoxin WrbA